MNEKVIVVFETELEICARFRSMLHSMFGRQVRVLMRNPNAGSIANRIQGASALIIPASEKRVAEIAEAACACKIITIIVSWQTVDREWVCEIPGAHFLTKPIDSDKLRQILSPLVTSLPVVKTSKLTKVPPKEKLGSRRPC